MSIKFSNLTKSFDQHTNVIEPLDLEFTQGKFIVLVGPSGCGKTTFLRLIAGLEDVSQGSIEINGKDVTWQASKDRAVAMVFQNYALYPHLSVYENLMYPLKMISISKDERLKRIQEVSQLLGIETLMKRRPAQLSGGQKQRVAIGRALVRKPDIFLFDEPLSNLDARLREQMRLEIAKLHQKLKRTTIYVTHDQLEAMTLADELVVMNQGKVLQVGPPLELYQNPNNLFVAEFLGSPPINKVDCKVIDEAQCKFSFGVFTFSSIPKTAFSATLVLGIRPENVWIQSGSESGKIKGTVTLVEHLGGECHIYVQVGRVQIVVKTGPKKFKNGEEVNLELDENQILWFDKNGRRLA